MSNITRTAGDTRRIGMRIMDNFEPLPLVGWSSFELVVGDAPDSESNIMSVNGIVFDVNEGRIAFTPSGEVPVGNYYFNCRAMDGNGERVTLSKGRYLVTAAIG